MPPTPNSLRDREWLRDIYVNQKKTCKDIAGILECKDSTVGLALRRLGIPLNKVRSKYPLLNDKKWLVDMYVNKKLSTEAIAKIAGGSSGAVYDMLKRLGIKMRSTSEAQRLIYTRGSHSQNWKGGRVESYNGYIAIYMPDHPSAMPNHYVLEHRLVMEKILGRYLESSEIIHHVDGNKANNKPENLLLLDRSKHKMTHKAIMQRMAYLENKLRIYEQKYGPITDD